jgi:prephenate dehydratase
VLLPVSFSLLGRPGTRREDVRVVATHPHAEAQCRRWLRTCCPARGAADAVHRRRRPRRLGGPLRRRRRGADRGEHYRLQVLASDVQDHSGAVTRFLLVSRPVRPLADRRGPHTLFAFIEDDHAGALLALLTEFAVAGST